MLMQPHFPNHPSLTYAARFALLALLYAGVSWMSLTFIPVGVSGAGATIATGAALFWPSGRRTEGGRFECEFTDLVPVAEDWLLVFEHDATTAWGRVAHDGKSYGLAPLDAPRPKP